ncbi:MAG: AsmA family protein [Deltaproteobacteria bacterium]|nr:MAG: AsmA family protein [Deltaproteobacteria bacterium]
MRWKKILFIVALLLIGLIVAIYVILSTYDFNKFKPRIIQAVREATGRELRLEGDLKVGLGLSARISIENGSFQNATWGSQAEMAGIKRLEVQVALLPLIRGRIEFERVVLVEPSFLLEFSQSGESNVDFGGSGKPGGTLPALTFHEVAIEKGTFTYKDDESKKTHRLILDRLNFGSTESKKPNRLAFKGTFNGRLFEIGGSLSHFALSPGAGEDVPVTLAAKFGESEVAIEGKIEDLIRGEALAFSLLAEGKTLRDIGNVAGIRGMPDLGPFKFATTVTGSFRRLAAEDIDLSIGADKIVAVNINGNIEDLLTQQGIKLNFTASGKDLVGLEKLIGQTLPMGGAFSISGKVYDPAPEIYSITDLKARLDSNEIGGSIDLDLTAQRPKISATLSSQKLDLRPILSALDKKSRRVGLSAQGAKKASENLPQEPPAHDLLTIADVDLTLHLNNILLPQLKLNELAAQVDLKDGRITVTAEGPSLPDTSELAGVKGLPELGPFKVAFDVTEPLKKLSVENLVFKAGAPTLADLKLTGTIKEPLAQRGIELNFSVRGQDVANLEKFSGQPLPLRGAFSVSGQISDSAAKIYKLRNLRAVLGDNKIGGTADFNLTGQNPRISAMLSSQKFNLRPLSLQNTDKLAGLANAADLGPFKLQAVMVGPAGKLSIEKLNFQAGTPKLAEIKIDGFIKDLLAQRGIELNFSVRGQDVANLEKFSGQPLPLRGAFSVSGQISDSAAKIYKLRNLRAVLGDNKIGGTADFNLTGQRPRISAALSSQKIDLEPLFSSSEQKSTVAKQPAESDTQKRNILPEIPLTADALTKANVDVNIRIEQIRLPRLVLDDLTIDMFLQDSHLTLTVASKSIPDIAELTGVAGLTQLGAVRLTIKASSLRDKLAVKKLDFDAHIEGIVMVTLDATAEDFLTQRGISIDFKAKGNDISKLEKLAGRQLPYKGAFTISGRLDDPAINTYKFSALTFIAGDNDLSGWVDLNLTGDRPKIKAELISQNLDLRWLYTTTDQNVSANQASTTVGKKRKKIFPIEPLPLDMLKIADLDIKIRAEKILLPRTVIRELIVDIMLADGHLMAKPLRFSAGDGSVQGYLDTHLVGQSIVITTDLKIDQIQLRSTLQQVEVSQVLDGTFDGKIRINSQGNSVAALMAGLNGSATIVQQGGRIDNRYLSLIGGNLTDELLKRVNIFDKKQKYIETNCTVIHSDINTGLTDNVFLLDTKDTKLIGAGKVNLHNETLDFVFKTSPKKGVKIPFLGRVGLSLGELTKPFKVSGTLANPSLVIDPSRTAVTLGKITGGLMLGPAGLAIVFADVSKKDVDPCQEAIDAIEAEDKTFNLSGPAATEDPLGKASKIVIEETKGAAKEASGSIKRLFGH